MARAIEHEAGFLGDHNIINEAVKEGFELTEEQQVWHDWEGESTDPDYDEGLNEAAVEAVEYLISKGFQVTSE